MAKADWKRKTLPEVLEEMGSAPDLAALAEREPLGPPPDGSPQLLGRYIVGPMLGEGGMGRVAEADDPHLRRRVAVKHLHQGLRGQRHQLERFVEEAEVTAQLEHPSIVPVYDMGITDDGQLYFVMRKITGQSLEEIVDALYESSPEAIGRYSRQRLLGIYQKVCMAVAYAHSRGVIHRDLKPQNVMVGEHGEVYVMDWGLCKVLADDETTGNDEERVKTVRTGTSAFQTASGMVQGTPIYMPPEQVTGKPDSGSVAGDIYSLGAMLYEILTLQPPVDGETVEEVLEHVAAGDIVPPRRRVPPERAVPEELEEICLKALSRKPQDRYASARDLHDAIERFLEGTADRERRRKAAASALEAGRRESGEYQEVWQRWREMELELYLARLRVPADVHWSSYQTVHEIKQRLDSLKEETVRVFGRAVRRYEEALSHEAENREARAELAQLYWSRFVAAEQRGDLTDALYFRQLLEAYDDGVFEGALRGDGVLRLETEPVEADATIRPFHDRNGVLMLGAETELGTTPVEVSPIAMGSYMVTLRAPGFRTTRVPVLVERQGRPRVRVRLRTDAEIGDGFIYVPAGPYVAGGDPLNPAAGPRRVDVVRDFAISVFPVTSAQYLEFVNAVAAVDMDLAGRHVPRRRFDGGEAFWSADSDGAFSLPRADADGDAWEPEHPVVHVSWHDASAYCQWLARTSGLAVRLPTSEEWEKAGRGVDGRVYPWGERFDPSFCKMGQSRGTRSLPEAVGTFSMDESPYGVRDMAGCVAEWCGGWFDERRGQRPLRGMGYDSSEFECRLTYVRGHRPYQIPFYAGFRVAHGFERR